MNAPLENQLGLAPIDQIGFVVGNLESAIALYEPMFGPFNILEPGEMTFRYRGKDEPCTLRIAFGRSGQVEIELIEWVSGECPHAEFIKAGREGLHHLRYRVGDLAETIARAEPLGYRAVWSCQFSEDMAVAYMQRDGDPLWIEFFQSP